MTDSLIRDMEGEVSFPIRRMLKVQLRALVDRSPDAVTIAVRSIRKYRFTFGHYPNIIFPRTFNEKVQARKIFDRRKILSTWADKLAVRSYVAGKSRIGILPTLYHVTTDPADIPFDRLPRRYVVKASHGCGWLRIVDDNTTVDRVELRRQCNEWLSSSYFEENLEWVYRDIKPRILVEEFLDNGHGEPPDDYKIYVFGGKVRFIQVDVARFARHRRSIYDPDWNLVPVKLTVERHAGTIPRPRRLEQMIQYAEELSGGIDFVRVDVYQVGDRIYFGEMTTTSGNGFNKFSPVSYDEVFGSFWNTRTPALSRLRGGPALSARPRLLRP